MAIHFTLGSTVVKIYGFDVLTILDKHWPSLSTPLQSPNHQKNSHTRRSGALTARFTLANLRHSAKKKHPLRQELSIFRNFRTEIVLKYYNTLNNVFNLDYLHHPSPRVSPFSRPSRRRWHARDAPGQCKRIWPQRRPGGTSPESVCSLWRVQPPMVDAGGVRERLVGDRKKWGWNWFIWWVFKMEIHEKSMFHMGFWGFSWSLFHPLLLGKGPENSHGFSECLEILMLIWIITILIPVEPMGMDWFKGKSTGNHGVYHQIEWGFLLKCSHHPILWCQHNTNIFTINYKVCINWALAQRATRRVGPLPQMPMVQAGTLGISWVPPKWSSSENPWKIREASNL